MNKLIRGAAALALFVGVSSTAMAGGWKEGVLWNEANVGGDLNGFTAVQIEFGFEPGKCSGPLTTVGEWLRVTEGKFSFAYADKTVERGADADAWYHSAGTTVEVCNKGDSNAILVGIQFRPVVSDQPTTQ